jgi:hypothetical protein
MANANTPFGLRPVGTIGSATYNGKVAKFYVPSTDATAIGIGDPVALAGGVYADGTPIGTRGSVGSKTVGIMVGVAPLYGGDLTVIYRKESTSMYILVETDPQTIYMVQEDSVGACLTLALGTRDIPMVLGTVDTTTGNSKTMVDSSLVAANAALDCKLLRPVQSPDNVCPLAYCKWLVKLNLHQYGPGAALAGV